MRVPDRGLFIQKSLNRVGQPTYQGDFDKSQRLPGHRGVEEGIAAPVGIQSIAQILERADGMDGFIGHQLFEQGGRRVPGDLLQLQKAEIEERSQNKDQRVIQRLELWAA